MASNRHCRRVCALVCQPTSTAKTGMSGSVTAMTTAEIQSVIATRATYGDGHQDPEHESCGRYRAK